MNDPMLAVRAHSEIREDLLDCLDSPADSEWTCRTGDGTGLWCDACLIAADIEALAAELERLRASLTEEVRTRCTCGSTVPGMVEWMTSHAMYDHHEPTFERRMATDWQEFKP